MLDQENRLIELERSNLRVSASEIDQRRGPQPFLDAQSIAVPAVKFMHDPARTPCQNPGRNSRRSDDDNLVSVNTNITGPIEFDELIQSSGIFRDVLSRQHRSLLGLRADGRIAIFAPASGGPRPHRSPLESSGDAPVSQPGR